MIETNHRWMGSTVPGYPGDLIRLSTTYSWKPMQQAAVYYHGHVFIEWSNRTSHHPIPINRRFTVPIPSRKRMTAAMFHLSDILRTRTITRWDYFMLVSPPINYKTWAWQTQILRYNSIGTFSRRSMPWIMRATSLWSFWDVSSL